MDSNFIGNCHKPTSPKYVSTSKLHTGYAIMHLVCTIIRYSNLKTQIEIRTTEYEYMELRKSLRDCIPVMLVKQETNSKGINTI